MHAQACPARAARTRVNQPLVQRLYCEPQSKAHGTVLYSGPLVIINQSINQSINQAVGQLTDTSNKNTKQQRNCTNAGNAGWAKNGTF